MFRILSESVIHLLKILLGKHKLSLRNDETDDAKWNSSPDAGKPGNYFKFK